MISFSDYLDQLPRWLAPVSTLAALVLLVALIALSMRHLRLRADMSAGPGSAPIPLLGEFDNEPAPSLTLEGEGRALVDSILPSHPRAFLAVVAAIAIGCWVIGLFAANDVARFVATPEWQAQPLYLAAHFITVRLFVTSFSRNFRAGAVHLDVPQEEVERAMRLVLGPIGMLAAVAFAIPFCVYDYRYAYQALGAAADGLGPAADRVIFAMWCVEWYLMAFIWVLLLGFLLLSRWVIGDHEFRSPIEIVLHDRQYRPFLRMSGQGATVVLLFFLVNAAYAWYTGAELSDNAGSAITAVLLVAGFLPPLVMLRGKVKRAVDSEMASLRRRLAAVLLTGQAAAMEGRPAGALDLDQRLDETVTLLRISYLERLYSELGHSESMDVAFKLIAPAITVGYYVLKHLKIMT